MSALNLQFDEEGLIPVIIQDFHNNEVLMLGFMNREALEETLKGPFVTFWSRSRRKLWLKGEESGHTQEVKEILFDCDADSLLIKVDQKVAACHEGYRSCFFRKISGAKAVTIAQPVFKPEGIYKK